MFVTESEEVVIPSFKTDLKIILMFKAEKETSLYSNKHETKRNQIINDIYVDFYTTCP